MNDNLTAEGPAHAHAMALLNDLMIILSNASKHGVERFDADGEPIYDFAFWSNQCAIAVGVKQAA